MELNKIYNESNLETMSRMPDNSVDAIVTDPPYGLGREPDPVAMLTAWLDHGYLEVSGRGFMGKEWDAFVPQPRFWKEAYRVLKPGGHVEAFFGTRTYDWGVMAMRLAGFEVRDQLAWCFGSGFPKSLDISKALDKAAGAEREVVGVNGTSCDMRSGNYRNSHGKERLENKITAPATPEAQQWAGWGSALKPALEPIVLARKPLGEKTIAANVLAWGTGGINVDGCRVEHDEPYKTTTGRKFTSGQLNKETNDGRDMEKWEKSHDGKGKELPASANPSGRWPANFTHDGSPEVLGLMPETTTNAQGNRIVKNSELIGKNGIYNKGWGDKAPNNDYANDSGSAARFFYCAKADATERNYGLPKGKKNRHPTVKPLALMRWLVRLITPPGGLVYDPFAGSGTTFAACMEEGFQFIGSEIDAEHAEVGNARGLARRSLFSQE